MATKTTKKSTKSKAKTDGPRRGRPVKYPQISQEVRDLANAYQKAITAGRKPTKAQREGKTEYGRQLAEVKRNQR